MKYFILMKNLIHTKEQARAFLIQEALNEINEVIDFSKFYTRVFCVFAKYGLLLDAKEEDFLSGVEWSNPACREILIKRVKQFLIKNIV